MSSNQTLFELTSYQVCVAGLPQRSAYVVPLPLTPIARWNVPLQPFWIVFVSAFARLLLAVLINVIDHSLSARYDWYRRLFVKLNHIKASILAVFIRSKPTEVNGQWKAYVHNHAIAWLIESKRKQIERNMQPITDRNVLKLEKHASPIPAESDVERASKKKEFQQQHIKSCAALDALLEYFTEQCNAVEAHMAPKSISNMKSPSSAQLPLESCPSDTSSPELTAQAENGDTHLSSQPAQDPNPSDSVQSPLSAESSPAKAASNELSPHEIASPQTSARSIRRLLRVIASYNARLVKAQQIYAQFWYRQVALFRSLQMSHDLPLPDAIYQDSDWQQFEEKHIDLYPTLVAGMNPFRWINRRFLVKAQEAAAPAGDRIAHWYKYCLQTADEDSIQHRIRLHHQQKGNKTHNKIDPTSPESSSSSPTSLAPVAAEVTIDLADLAVVLHEDLDEEAKTTLLPLFNLNATKGNSDASSSDSKAEAEASTADHEPVKESAEERRSRAEEQEWQSYTYTFIRNFLAPNTFIITMQLFLQAVHFFYIVATLNSKVSGWERYQELFGRWFNSGVIDTVATLGILYFFVVEPAEGPAADIVDADVDFLWKRVFDRNGWKLQYASTFDSDVLVLLAAFRSQTISLKERLSDCQREILSEYFPDAAGIKTHLSQTDQILVKHLLQPNETICRMQLALSLTADERGVVDELLADISPSLIRFLRDFSSDCESEYHRLDGAVQSAIRSHLRGTEYSVDAEQTSKNPIIFVLIGCALVPLYTHVMEGFCAYIWVFVILFIVMCIWQSIYERMEQRAKRSYLSVRSARRRDSGWTASLGADVQMQVRDTAVIAPPDTRETGGPGDTVTIPSPESPPHLIIADDRSESASDFFSPQSTRTLFKVNVYITLAFSLLCTVGISVIVLCVQVCFNYSVLLYDMSSHNSNPGFSAYVNIIVQEYELRSTTCYLDAIRTQVTSALAMANSF